MLSVWMRRRRPCAIRLPIRCDINSDGLVELPELVSLRQRTRRRGVFLIRWYLTWGGDGSRMVRTTYHGFPAAGMWTIPESWDERITISRADEVEGARGGLVFSSWNTGSAPAEPIFTIYAFTGDRRMERAQQDGRFLLLEQTDAVYSASLGTANQAKNLTQDELRQMFHIIHVDWNSGET